MLLLFFTFEMLFLAILLPILRPVNIFCSWPGHHVANTGRSRILMLRRFYKPLEGPGGSGYPPSRIKREWDVYTVAAKGFLEVPGLPEPMGLDHRDHRDLRAEGGQGEGGGGGV